MTVFYIVFDNSGLNPLLLIIVKFMTENFLFTSNHGLDIIEKIFHIALYKSFSCK